MIDLHLHSILSDGELSIPSLIKKIDANNINYAVLTDHDCIIGTDAFIKKCESIGVQSVPGVELQAYKELKTSDYLHILCYNFKDSKRLHLFLEEERKNRINAINESINLLKKLKIYITIDDIKKMSEGRHLLINHLCLYLQKQGIMDYSTAYSLFCHESSEFYVPYPKITVEETISFIHDIGGLAVLAHPKRLHLDRFRLEEYVKHLKKCGLDGIETYYSFNNPDDTHISEYLAKKYNLFETAGSDWHCEEENIPMGVNFIPERKKELILRRLFDE